MPQASFLGRRDPVGVRVEGRGAQTALNVNSARVIKTGPGRVGRVSIVVAGTTSGAWTINDCAATADASNANRLWTIAFNASDNVAGRVIDIDLPFTTGLVVSAVPGAGSPQAAISFV